MNTSLFPRTNRSSFAHGSPVDSLSKVDQTKPSWSATKTATAGAFGRVSEADVCQSRLLVVGASASKTRRSLLLTLEVQRLYFP